MRATRIVAILLAVGLPAVLVLGFLDGVLPADPEPAQPPFANSVQQRMEMIAELKRIRELLTEQNELLSQQTSLLKEQLEILKRHEPSRKPPEDESSRPGQSPASP